MSVMDEPDLSGAWAREPKPLGKIHMWWLREFAKCEGGRMATGGHGGAYGAAFKTLCERKLIALDMSFDSFGLFTLTDAGRESLSSAK